MPVDLPADVTGALVQRGPTLGNHEVILLPHETRQGQTYYIDDDLDALTIARSEGLDVAFLHDGAERRYLHENAAGWELTAALAVGETLTSAGIVALSRYLWQRVRHAKEQGLYEGDEAAAPIKLTLAQVRQDGPTGDVTAQAVKLEGSLDDVTAALDRFLGRAQE